LSIEIIQPEGKKSMDIMSFLQGNSIEDSDIIS
jgi:methionyl-tRNA formyltransferase